MMPPPITTTSARWSCLHDRRCLSTLRAVPLRVCVAGVTGWTGRAVAEAVASADDLELVAGVSRSDPTSFSSVEEALDTVPVDVVVDYTHADAVKGHVLAALD